MGTVVGVWRLRLIILLFVTLTSLYTVNGLFYGITTDEAGFVVDEDTLQEDSDSSTDNFVSILFTIGDYLTFGNIQNIYARILINIFTTSCWITIGYIIYTFFKEWIPLV